MCVCAVERRHPIITVYMQYSFFPASYSTFSPYCTRFSSVETSAIDLKLYHNVQSRLSLRFHISVRNLTQSPSQCHRDTPSVRDIEPPHNNCSDGKSISVRREHTAATQAAASKRLAICPRRACIAAVY